MPALSCSPSSTSCTADGAHGLSAQNGAVRPLKSHLPVGARRSKLYPGVRRDEAAMARVDGAHAKEMPTIQVVLRFLLVPLGPALYWVVRAGVVNICDHVR